MNRQESRRINPLAHVAVLAVLVLVAFEVLAICNAVELKAGTVAKYAPWAYEPFLRLVGEHPDSAPRFAVVQEEEPTTENRVSAMVGLTGLAPASIPVLMPTNGVVPPSNVVLEVSVPLDPAPGLESGSTNAPGSAAAKIVPVG